jgi:hypothetical protein
MTLEDTYLQVMQPARVFGLDALFFVGTSSALDPVTLKLPNIPT